MVKHLKEMTNRERILAVFRREPIDQIPFMHWDRHFPRGQIERELRNRGMGLCCVRPCYVESHPNVEVVQKYCGKGRLVRTYHTPVGSVTEKLRVGIGYGQARYGRDWKGMTPKRIEYMIKDVRDYDVVRFIVEDAHYEPYYEAIKDAQRRIGEDGIVVTAIGYSPFQKILIDLAGAARLYVDFFKNRDKVEKLYYALADKQSEIYSIAAKSPAEYVGYGDNIDGVMVSAPIFEKYHLPMYERCAEVVHAEGKVLGVHMDGRLSNLAESIAKSEIDIIEAFTPPPMGNLPLRDALSLWRRKVIWMNFPSSVYVLGSEEVRKHLISLLREAVPGERLVVAASTENIVAEECLMAFTEVMEKATFPLSQRSIDKIQRELKIVL